MTFLEPSNRALVILAVAATGAAVYILIGCW
jgi:hypothetical protein